MVLCSELWIPFFFLYSLIGSIFIFLFFYFFIYPFFSLCNRREEPTHVFLQRLIAEQEWVYIFWYFLNFFPPSTLKPISKILFKNYYFLKINVSGILVVWSISIKHINNFWKSQATILFKTHLMCSFWKKWNNYSFCSLNFWMIFLFSVYCSIDVSFKVVTVYDIETINKKVPKYNWAVLIVFSNTFYNHHWSRDI